MAIKIHLSKIMGDRKVRLTNLSDRSGISRNTLLHLYHEDGKGVQFHVLDRLCKTLDCSLSDLIEYIPDELVQQSTVEKTGKRGQKYPVVHAAQPPTAPERPTEAAAPPIEEQPPAKRTRARKPAQVKPATETAPAAEAKPKRTRKTAERQ